MKSWIAYGKEKLWFDIPRNMTVEEIMPTAYEPNAPPETLIHNALIHPIGSSGIETIVKPGNSVCIISDDISRPTPVALILDALLPLLAGCGIRKEDIFILIALGSHRAMTRTEIEQKIDRRHMNEIRVLQPQFSSPDDCIAIGTSSAGNPVLVQAAAMKADIRIGIGNIAPHNTLGWSGGAKIAFPGIAYEESVAEFHMQAAMHPAPLFGVKENPVRNEIEGWAKKMGLSFIINTILSRDHKLIDCVAGNFVAAHRQGVEKAEKVYGVPLDTRYDIVIADMEPYSFDFWQGTKALNAAVPMVKPGGAVILAGPCQEGVGPHEEYPRFMGMQGKNPLSFHNGGIKGADPLAVSVGYMIGRQMQHFDTMMLTGGLSLEELKEAGIRKINDIGGALKEIGGDRPLSVAVLRDGGDILPVYRNPQ